MEKYVVRAEQELGAPLLQRSPLGLGISLNRFPRVASQTPAFAALRRGMRQPLGWRAESLWDFQSRRWKRQRAAALRDASAAAEALADRGAHFVGPTFYKPVLILFVTASKKTGPETVLALNFTSTELPVAVNDCVCRTIRWELSMRTWPV